MKRPSILVALAACLLSLIHAVEISSAPARSENWPQFRGPNGAGIAAPGRALPVEFGPDKNVAWKTPLPAGHSSPGIWGDRIFLTGLTPAGQKLEVLCLDRRSGKILWRRAAPTERIEKVHAVGSPATATPATDGERVVAYFGSCGLLCYDFAGKLVVFAVGDRLEVLARNDLGEPIMATPAIVDGHLYVRTAGHLYSFAAK
jgi:outer membrane protein assembly factor BamB